MSFLAATGRYFHYLARFFVDTAAGLSERADQEETLLLVRPDGIGDFIVWLGSAPLLIDKHDRTVLVANRLFADLASQLDMFDEVIAVDVRRYEHKFRYRFDVSRRIRAIGANIVIQPVLSRKFWTGDAMVRVSRASERIGTEGDLSNMRSWQQQMARGWYTRRLPVDMNKPTEFERNATFLSQLGIRDVAPRAARLPVVADLPQQLRTSGSYFVVFPGAGSHKRLWPADQWADVTRQLAECTGLRPVICGGPGDEKLADTILDGAAVEDAFSLAGNTSLPELVEVLRAARFLVGNETSAVHIAAAVNTPSVCLLGGGHFGRFVPYPEGVADIAPVPVFTEMDCFGCNWQCTQPHVAGEPTPCITGITVNQVVAAVQSMIGEGDRHVVEAH